MPETTTLSRKIDFAVVIRVKNANPNGDPLNGNRPRTDYDGTGEISDVCLKRKLRDRLQEEGENIFVQSDDRRKDEYPSLERRARGVLGALSGPDTAKRACAIWFDVRAFGNLFAIKAEKGAGKSAGKAKGKDKADNDAPVNESGETEAANGGSGGDTGVSIGVRGPVTLQSAFSVNPVEVTSTQITKSVSGEGDGAKRSSDTMGMKHRVDHGIYVAYGSMNPQLAERTGFSDEDAAAIKAILPRLLENDASSARPEGSMDVAQVVWWEHPSRGGACSSAKVHASLSVDGDTGAVTVEPLSGLTPELISGF